jgi:hypothetical protein
MRTRPHTILVALTLALGFPAHGSPQGQPGATGEWKGWATGSLRVMARIADQGGKLGGTLTICPFGACSTSALTGTRSGTKVIFRADFDDPVTVKATLSGDTLSGSLTIGGTPEITANIRLTRGQ